MILNNSFETIFESITSCGDDREEGETGPDIPEKYAVQFKKVVKLITDDFGGDKQKYIIYVSDSLYI